MKITELFKYQCVIVMKVIIKYIIIFHVSYNNSILVIVGDTEFYDIEI